MLIVFHSISFRSNSSPLDLNVLSPQSAIAAAAAAAAAAACANDPNKFQALLLERTKALAAEALKNGASDAASEGEFPLLLSVIIFLFRFPLCFCCCCCYCCQLVAITSGSHRFISFCCTSDNVNGLSILRTHALIYSATGCATFMVSSSASSSTSFSVRPSVCPLFVRTSVRPSVAVRPS